MINEFTSVFAVHQWVIGAYTTVEKSREQWKCIKNIREEQTFTLKGHKNKLPVTHVMHLHTRTHKREERANESQKRFNDGRHFGFDVLKWLHVNTHTRIEQNLPAINELTVKYVAVPHVQLDKLIRLAINKSSSIIPWKHEGSRYDVIVIKSTNVVVDGTFVTMYLRHRSLHVGLTIVAQNGKYKFKLKWISMKTHFRIKGSIPSKTCNCRQIEYLIAIDLIRLKSRVPDWIMFMVGLRRPPFMCSLTVIESDGT